MPDEPHEPPARHGTIAENLRLLLSYSDKPWKAAALIVALVLLGIGWILYERRDELFEAWLTPSTPELKTADIPDALAKLASETNADLVQIWAVDLGTNSQWFLGARRHDGERPVIPSPRRLPIIDHTSDVKKLVSVLEGQPVCVDLDGDGTPVVRRLVERGMRRGCAVPIPPSREAFLGVIYLSWANTTDTSNENVAVGAAREIASKLATH